MPKPVHSGPRSERAQAVQRLPGHLNCTSADSGPFAPALLPYPLPVKPLKLDSPRLLAQEPRLLQPPHPSPSRPSQQC